MVSRIAGRCFKFANWSKNRLGTWGQTGCFPIFFWRRVQHNISKLTRLPVSPGVNEVGRRLNREMLMGAHHKQKSGRTLFSTSYSIARAHGWLATRRNQTRSLNSSDGRGFFVYKLNGKRVEDRKDNSLLKNLAEVVTARGSKTPVFIIIDVHAPFTEIGKLETALDKADLTYARRLFVTDFRKGTMNEIHWDHSAVPIPRH
jgi:hypothetical protein